MLYARGSGELVVNKKPDILKPCLRYQSGRWRASADTACVMFGIDSNNNSTQEIRLEQQVLLCTIYKCDKRGEKPRLKQW